MKKTEVVFLYKRRNEHVVMMTGRTHSSLQSGDLIPGLAELLQHLMQLALHALTVKLFILKVLGGELDLRRG